MRYDDWKWGVEPFKPNHMTYQALALAPVLVVFFLIVTFVPDLFLLDAEPANTIETPEHIKPEWYFLPAYQMLKTVPSKVNLFGQERVVFGDLAEFIGVAVQLVFLLAVFLLPFLDRNPERRPARRPVMMTIGAVSVIVIVLLGVWGHYS